MRNTRDGRGPMAARNRGWSVTELLVGLSLSAVVVTQAVPAYQWLLMRNRLALASNQLLGALHEARQLAISSNTAVTFCAGNGSAGCHGDWSRQEWLLFSDRNRNGVVDAGEFLKSSEALSPVAEIVIAGNGPFRRAVVFRPDGLARTATGAFAAGRLRICAPYPFAHNANDLMLIGSGRAEMEARHLDGACPAP